MFTVAWAKVSGGGPLSADRCDAARVLKGRPPGGSSFPLLNLIHGLAAFHLKDIGNRQLHLQWCE